ncbi:hypothetical protein GUITHDRAFT_150412 [Guillardia theta CCMP2712]|uniref:Uncharacterized protein n=2 Tax=Guillardia theta TaxID=55529 RepID=L1JZB7_GUITC|nr:hypothetical protein GUITHDRAFT_150412 [Guillardia theta CCMP2712]EKX53443.1 hypothetical protein GUITHDRAFT_150412 [Guillardia theta CCMP2712]|mmetsp:Transcript_839/g.2569  ORF Transcript_839/g.2569 Transcript_839/m.2569 type:complete len:215 (+) Transcript_839:310-954(+)|eukprot:XP_005840423.1 hypothetical protein GUITHDRAFT_150412 [Guillardia theta CCMP2712]
MLPASEVRPAPDHLTARRDTRDRLLPPPGKTAKDNVTISLQARMRRYAPTNLEELHALRKRGFLEKTSSLPLIQNNLDRMRTGSYGSLMQGMASPIGAASSLCRASSSMEIRSNPHANEGIQVKKYPRPAQTWIDRTITRSCLHLDGIAHTFVILPSRWATLMGSIKDEHVATDDLKKQTQMAILKKRPKDAMHIMNAHLRIHPDSPWQPMCLI